MCESCEAREAKQMPVLGVVSGPLMVEIKAHRLALMNAELDLEQSVLNGKREFINDQLTTKQADVLQKHINAQRDKMEARYTAEHVALWERVELELGLDPEKDYDLDASTGEVRECVEEMPDFYLQEALEGFGD